MPLCELTVIQTTTPGIETRDTPATIVTTATTIITTATTIATTATATIATAHNATWTIIVPLTAEAIIPVPVVRIPARPTRTQLR